MLTITNFNQYPTNKNYISFEARYKLKKSDKLVSKPIMKTVSTAWFSGFSTAGMLSRFNILYHIFS